MVCLCKRIAFYLCWCEKVAFIFNGKYHVSCVNNITVHAFYDLQSKTITFTYMILLALGFLMPLGLDLKF